MADDPDALFPSGSTTRRGLLSAFSRRAADALPVPDNLVARPTSGIDGLRPAEYEAGRRALFRKIARVKPQVLVVLRADGFVERVGTDHIHGNVHRAVEAQLRE